MTEQNKRQCFAYNTAKQRCSKAANHRGLHEIRFTWNDEECFNPDVPPLTTPQPMPLPALPTPIPDDAPPATPTKCVACGHLHKAGECKCGCHEHIG